MHGPESAEDDRQAALSLYEQMNEMTETDS